MPMPVNIQHGLHNSATEYYICNIEDRKCAIDLDLPRWDIKFKYALNLQDGI